MAVDAAIFYSDKLFALDLYPAEARERVGDAPPEPVFAPDSPLIFKWDAAKLDRGERELVGLKVLNLERLTERDLLGLDTLLLPRVNCLDAGVVDQSIVDVLRWARQTLPGTEARMIGWPDLSDRSVRKPTRQRTPPSGRRPRGQGHSRPTTSNSS